MSLKYIAIAISALLLFGGCENSSQDEALNSLVSQNTYELKDLQSTQFNVIKSGNNYSIEGMQDKVIIFDIFATWCPPCRASASSLASLQEKYKSDVKVIGVLIEEDKEDSYVQKFVDQYGADYSISNAKDNKQLSRAIAGSIGMGQGFGIPLMVMYYKGKYINHYKGVVPEEMIESDIRLALKK